MPTRTAPPNVTRPLTSVLPSVSSVVGACRGGGAAPGSQLLSTAAAASGLVAASTAAGGPVPPPSTRAGGGASGTNDKPPTAGAAAPPRCAPSSPPPPGPPGDTKAAGGGGGAANVEWLAASAADTVARAAPEATDTAVGASPAAPGGPAAAEASVGAAGAIVAAAVQCLRFDLSTSIHSSVLQNADRTVNDGLTTKSMNPIWLLARLCDVLSQSGEIFCSSSRSRSPCHRRREAGVEGCTAGRRNSDQ